ncbi:hypothetical protein [Kordiimonas laminariae]|uniref:hypothetical protein n=1 Tax=Kordiimonas laminariae TaxID=2917717 RepID=UPI001FF5757B|nr:hypothetical protein [Kordiimonas laminariae]MCK0068488.1 hypothetical protein [Kordiimonas laminariae]
MDNIGRNLLALRILIIILVSMMSILHVLYWLYPSTLSEVIATHELVDQYGGFERLDTQQRALGFTVTLASVALLCWSMILIYRLSLQIGNHEWFSALTEKLCLQLGKTLFFYTLARLMENTLLILVLTMNNPEGERTFALTISSSQVVILIPAFLAIIAAQVVKAGRLQKEELQQII